MNRITLKFALLAGLALIFCCSALEAAALKVGYQAGNLKFTKPLTEADQKYLGLQKAGVFSLRDIRPGIR